MSWLGLDPESVQARLTGSGQAPRALTLAQSLMLGALGFGVVSVIAYSAWAFGGRWLYLHVGEAGLYAVCAALFMVLSGVVLHRLLIGPGALGRFYALFAVAFGAYAVAWCAGWFILRGKAGEWTGSLAGTAIFAAVIAWSFSAFDRWWKIALVLFVTHSAGYFAGGWAYEQLSAIPSAEIAGWFLDKSKMVKLGMLSWGLAYGIGFGIGLGYALYVAQEKTRARL